MPSGRKADRRKAREQALFDDDDDETWMAASGHEIPSNDQDSFVHDTSLAVRLAPYSEQVKRFLGILRDIEPNLEEIKQTFAKHADDIASAEDIHKENDKLKCEIDEQIRDIKNLEGSIQLLTRSSDGATQGLEKAKLEFEAKQLDLDNERLEFEEKAAERMQIEENRRQMQAADLEGEYENRRLELEQEFQQKEARLMEVAQMAQREATSKFRKQEAALVDQKRILEDQLQQAEERNKTLKYENKDLLEKMEDDRRVKSSLKIENQQLNEKFDSVNDRFACHSRSLEAYRNDFEVIEDKIKRLSEECQRRFDSVPLDELDAIRSQLEQEDSLFREVPISESDQSVLLNRVHIRRVIASSIVRNIWKPFSCDELLDQPKLSELLLYLQHQVMASTHPGSCQEIFWRVQTSKACQQAELTNSAQAETIVTTAPRPTTESKRLTKTQDEIESFLQPLIDPERSHAFADGLRDILRLAIEVWDEAATDDKAFEAEIILAPETYTHCRAIEFDSDQENDDVRRSDAASITDTAVMSSSPSSYGRLLTLFPRIQSRLPMDDLRLNVNKAVPGEFPQEDGAHNAISSTRDPQIIETIHAGRALSDDCLLIREGREEVQERDDLRDKEFKEAHNRIQERHKTHIQTRRKSTAVKPPSTDLVTRH